MSDSSAVSGTIASALQSRGDGPGDISEAEFAKISAAFDKLKPSDRAQVLAGLQDHRELRDVLSRLDGRTAGAQNAGYQLYTSLVAAQARAVDTLAAVPPAKDFDDNGVPHGFAEGSMTYTAGNPTRTIFFIAGEDQKKIQANTTDGAAAAARRAQVTMCKNMGAAHNPPTLAEVKTYLQGKVAAGATADEVQATFKDFLNTFYAHASVSWNNGGANPSGPVDAGNFQSLLSEMPVMRDGRTPLNCIGSAMVTEMVLGGLTGKDGAPMFDIRHAQNAGHVLTGVFPRGSGSSFVVSDMNVDRMPVKSATVADREAALQEQLDKRAPGKGHFTAHYGSDGVIASGTASA